MSKKFKVYYNGDYLGYKTWIVMCKSEQYKDWCVQSGTFKTMQSAYKLCNWLNGKLGYEVSKEDIQKETLEIGE